jgi:hypothetical protein
MMDVTREELREQLAHIDSEIRLLRGRKALLMYKLEQNLREKDRVMRHLSALDRGEEQKAC